MHQSPLRKLLLWLCTYQCQAQGWGGGFGHRVGIWIFSKKKSIESPHPCAKKYWSKVVSFTNGLLLQFWKIKWSKSPTCGYKSQSNSRGLPDPRPPPELDIDRCINWASSLITHKSRDWSHYLAIRGSKTPIVSNTSRYLCFNLKSLQRESSLWTTYSIDNIQRWDLEFAALKQTHFQGIVVERLTRLVGGGG